MPRPLLLDPFGGLAGDMLLGACFDLGLDPEDFQRALSSLGLPFELELEAVQRRHLRATKVHFRFPPESDHRHLSEILGRIGQSSLSPHAQAMAESMFRRLGEVEARRHGIPLQEVHFHEVGATDSILDLVGFAYALDQFECDSILTSPLPLGSGVATMAHGEMPLPAPATLDLVAGFPARLAASEKEMVTPTGAACLAALGSPLPSGFAAIPKAQGYGAGSRADSVLRLTLLEAPSQAETATSGWVHQLSTHLDDLDGESLGFLLEILRDGPALDVWVTATTTKKNRPGHELTVLCPAGTQAEVEATLFRHSGTLGIRHQLLSRSTLARSIETESTSFGEVRLKRSPHGRKFEADDLARIAREHGLSLQEVRDQIEEELLARA